MKDVASKIYEVKTMDSTLRERIFTGKITGYRESISRKYIHLRHGKTTLSISINNITNINEIDNIEGTKHIYDVGIECIVKSIPVDFYKISPGDIVRIGDLNIDYSVEAKEYVIDYNIYIYSLKDRDGNSFKLITSLDKINKIELKKNIMGLFKNESRYDTKI